MWIFAKGVGFLSIVQDNSDDSMMCVRARNREHLVEALGNVLNESDYVETPDGDYRWRATVDRDLVMQLVAECVEEIDYTTNVKGTISASDEPLHRAMMTCWGAMALYQDSVGEDDVIDDYEDEPEDGPVVAVVPAKRARELMMASAEAVASIGADDFEENS